MVTLRSYRGHLGQKTVNFQVKMGFLAERNLNLNYLFHSLVFGSVPRVPPPGRDPRRTRDSTHNDL